MDENRMKLLKSMSPHPAFCRRRLENYKYAEGDNFRHDDYIFNCSHTTSKSQSAMTLSFIYAYDKTHTTADTALGAITDMKVADRFSFDNQLSTAFLTASDATTHDVLPSFQPHSFL